MTGSDTTNTHTACREEKINSICCLRKRPTDRKFIHLKRPEDGEADDVPFVILELLVSSDFHNPVQ